MHIHNKLLGQNFLIDKNILNKIVNYLELTNKNILEIGGGMGNLTQYILAKRPNNLVVLEKDKRCSDYLQENFNCVVKNVDCLNYKYENLHIIMGNLPYNISGDILKLLYLQADFSEGLFMVQKEQAERIIAQPRTKKYGSLSVICQIDWQVKKLFDVSPNCFSPRPKVISSVIYIKNEQKIDFLKKKKILNMVYNFFQNRRKKIKIHPFYDLCADQISPKDYLELCLLNNLNNH